MAQLENAYLQDRAAKLFHLKLVAKIALGVSAIACAGLLALLVYVADVDGGSAYRQVIGARSLAREHLDQAYLAFSLALTALAGVLTWLLALYGSFRIAGPLYRFARNLELQMERGRDAPLPIRREDQLQSEAVAVAGAIAAVHAHYDDLRRALGRIELAAQDGPQAPAAMQAAHAEFAAIERRAQL